MRAKGTLSLKEWAVVCEALASGDQVILLRKGGLGEKRGFEVAGTEFLLFPSFEHQHGMKIRSEHTVLFERARAGRPPEGRLRIGLSARVVGTTPLTVPGSPTDPSEIFDRTRDLHVYTPELIAERVAYRPQAPLVAVVLDVRPLARTLDLIDERRYAGCRSWVDLPPLDAGATTGSVVPPAALGGALALLRALTPEPVRP